jgi:hypothetical protein
MNKKNIVSKKRNMMILIIMFCQTLHGFIYSKQSQQFFVNPVMQVSNLRINNEVPIQLEKLNIDIKILGQIAITTLEMTYHNPNERVMEGEFNFPLDDGQVVTRFALDINGVLRDGVIVEKEQGRKTFEAIVRRGVDPGLLEKTQGNNFRMRIYPLPAMGTRKIVLAFQQELADKGNYGLYFLPLKINESLKKFSIHAEVIKKIVKLDSEKNELTNFSFNKWNDSYIADFEQDNFVPDKQIALAFPHTSSDEQVFTATKNIKSDSSYFYINVRPEPSEQVKILPKKITILWDNSNSAQDRNKEKELGVLGNYIQKIGNLTIELVPFNIKTGKTEIFEITNGNWSALESRLKTLDYDGGTSFGSLDFSKYKSDEILLFSDGMTTFGKSEPQLSHTPVYTFQSNTVANPSFLTYLAQNSGGEFIDLNKLSSEEVLSKLTNNHYHFISSQVLDGRVSNIYPSMPCQFNNTFSLTGNLCGKSATLVLNFGFGTTISYKKTITINADNSTDKSILSRLWAEKKIAELSYNEEKNKSEITKIGKQFGIVTSNTSLIVLDNINDYLKNDIIPPIDMQEEYFKLKTIHEKDDNEKMKNHIESVVKLSEEQSKWWNKNYPITPKKSKKGKRINSMRFTPPVITQDEAVADEMKSQDEMSNSQQISILEVSDYNVRESNNAVIKKEMEDVTANKDKNIAIEMNSWDPQTPYLKVLQYATIGTEYPTYLKLKKEYGLTPSFYMDVADFFSKSGKKDTAIIILSNLADLKLESPNLLRSIGNKLLDFKCYEEAVMVFEKVLKMRREEPQSFRDLGLAYDANGNYQQAIRTLYEVIKKDDEDTRFNEIELIVMNEINNIINSHTTLDYSFIDKRLIKKEPVNIRVCLSWDTDNCDMDLWVTDPTGEKCFFQNKLTKIGGKISFDITNGYGPEEFMIKKALSGKYIVQANYYGTRSQTLLAPVNLHLVFYTNYGEPNQKKQEVTIRLENQKDVIDVGKFSFINN